MRFGIYYCSGRMTWVRLIIHEVLNTYQLLAETVY
jgi:DUF1365 family protein